MKFEGQMERGACRCGLEWWGLPKRDESHVDRSGRKLGTAGEGGRFNHRIFRSPCLQVGPAAPRWSHTER